MAETPNHNYNRPAQGEPDWHTPLNENFAALDADIEIRGEGGPKEGDNDYDPVDGAKYLDTQAGVIYFGDSQNGWSEAFDITGGGIESLVGGDGIAPGTIENGDQLSVAWSDAANLDASGAMADWSGASDLDADGSLTDNTVSVAGNTVALGGATDIAHADLASVSSNDHHNRPTAGSGLDDFFGTFEVMWEDASDLDATGAIADWASASELDAGGSLTAGAVDTGNIGQNGASNGHVFRWNGTSWETGFPGTTDNTPFDLQVDGMRALRLESGGVSPPNVIGGHPNNTVAPDAGGVAIAGGGSDSGNENVAYDNYGAIGGGYGNQVGNDDGNDLTAEYATVGGGQSNTASEGWATVGGGESNTASANRTTVGGGINNTAISAWATIGGGGGNDANGLYATIGGGNNNTAGRRGTVGGGGDNTASGYYATVPGGRNNLASGTDSFAAGDSAKSEGLNAFVWNDGSAYHDTTGDGSVDSFSSEQGVNGEPVYGSNTFSVSASSGVRFVTGSNEVAYLSDASAGWSPTSSRTAKTNIDPIDPETALDGVDSLSISTWEYKDEDGEGKGATHIGPMAEDFHEAFDVGDSDQHINSINADGVALAAIQGLSSKLDEKDEQIEALESEIDQVNELESECEQLRAENEQLRDRNRHLEDRLATIEERLDIEVAEPAAD